MKVSLTIGNKRSLLTIGLLVSGLLNGSNPLWAQASVPAGKLLLKEGTEIKLKFAQELSSKTSAEGDPVTFTLDEDIRIGDAVVVKAGSKAVGSVTNSKRAGMMGKAGELNIRLDHIKTDDGKIRLRGTKGKSGDDKTGTAVALTVLLGPIGLVKHGKEVVVKEGTPLTAYVDDDISLSPVK